MARREVIIYRVCDRPHRGEVTAVSTEKVALNGYRYEVDLCQSHVDELHQVVAAFTDYGRQVGIPSVIDKARPAERVEAPPAPRPKPTPVQAELARERALKRRDMPHTAERWLISDHALERMVERDVDIYEVLMTAELPEHDSPPTRSRKDPDVRERHREDIKIFVNVRTMEVLTVARKSQSEFNTTEKQKASA